MFFPVRSLSLLKGSVNLSCNHSFCKWEHFPFCLYRKFKDLIGVNGVSGVNGGVSVYRAELFRFSAGVHLLQLFPSHFCLCDSCHCFKTRYTSHELWDHELTYDLLATPVFHHIDPNIRCIMLPEIVWPSRCGGYLAVPSAKYQLQREVMSQECGLHTDSLRFARQACYLFIKDEFGNWKERYIETKKHSLHHI